MVEGLNEREESRKFHQDLATGAEREEDHSKRTATEPSMRQGIGFGGMEGEVRSAVSVLASLAGGACGFPGNLLELRWRER